MISGLVMFIVRVHSCLPGTEKSIICFGVGFENPTCSRHHLWPLATRLCDRIGLSQVTLTYTQFGGGTDARFLSRFGSSLGVTHLPEA